MSYNVPMCNVQYPPVRHQQCPTMSNCAMFTEQCPLELMCNCASAQCTTVHCAMSNVWRPTMCHCVTMQYPMSNVHLPDYGNVLQWWTTVLHSKQYPLRNVHLHIYLWQCPTMCHCTAPCVIVHIVQWTMSTCDIVLPMVSHCTHCAICDVLCYTVPAAGIDGLNSVNCSLWNSRVLHCTAMYKDQQSECWCCTGLMVVNKPVCGEGEWE